MVAQAKVVADGRHRLGVRLTEELHRSKMVVDWRQGWSHALRHTHVLIIAPMHVFTSLRADSAQQPPPSRMSQWAYPQPTAQGHSLHASEVQFMR